MKTLKSILKAMNFEGHISLRRKIFRDIVYIGGGCSQDIIDRFGGYKVDSMNVIDSVLIIYVN